MAPTAENSSEEAKEEAKPPAAEASDTPDEPEEKPEGEPEEPKKTDTVDIFSSVGDPDKEKALPDYRMPSLWAQMVDPLNNQLKSPPHSSLASYCMAELLLEQREYQASVNGFRDSLVISLLASASP